MKKIILAIDSFKGCLTSAEVGQCVEQTIKEQIPYCQVIPLAVSDGGEGILDILVKATQGHFITIEAHDPLMRIRKARYGVSGDGKTAIIEMAEINGLPLVPEKERDPMKTTTYGTGELIADALKRGYRNFLVGIGGSATNDAGLGMLQALGAKLYDGEKLLEGYGGQTMGQVNRIDTNGILAGLEESSFVVACDVHNPFCGPQGAAYVFGAQKGGTPAQLAILDKAMYSLSAIIEKTTGKKVKELQGGGAAGGLGAAFYAFMHAQLKPGINLMLDAVGFDNYLDGTDLVITGEGKADSQTLQGKVPAGVLERANRHSVPVALLAGKIEDKDLLKKAGFKFLLQTSPDTLPLPEAMKPKIAWENIRRATLSLLKSVSPQSADFQSSKSEQTSA